ncbi:conserved hypothetical protein [Frankia canadensis]|uniref:Uncharacterized protein n=1 Tax=Frankia canadensis TaxID=1836972 RepID=A0A2I2KK16_9ACTN|nr:conserved hypothetical protein [Frankia canadensis]SOU53301.1 conserved hypothetical protein [Frankia canadensis]
MEVPARVDMAGERGTRSAGLLGTRELRPIVVVAAFLVAILLGVGIGYATADRGSDAVTAAPTAPAAALTPAQRVPFWATSRHPGAGHQMVLTAEPDPTALRFALQWTVADRLKADGTGTVTAQQVKVVEGMYFGAVEGADAAQDEYWAIGRIEVPSLPTVTSGPYVWRRIGSGPWAILASGATACGQIPQPLLTVWKGQPPPCTA